MKSINAELIKRLAKRNRELYQKYKIMEKLTLCLMREEDNAFQRNLKAIEYIDKKLKKKKPYHDILKHIKKILAMHEGEDIFDVINKELTNDRNNS